jgi:hypothetical protein
LFSNAKGNYFLMTYSWKKGEEAQVGVFLFGGNEKAVTASWGDSFHMAAEPMLCKGELKDGGKKLYVRRRKQIYQNILQGGRARWISRQRVEVAEWVQV